MRRRSLYFTTLLILPIFSLFASGSSGGGSGGGTSSGGSMGGGTSSGATATAPAASAIGVQRGGSTGKHVTELQDKIRQQVLGKIKQRKSTDSYPVFNKILRKNVVWTNKSKRQSLVNYENIDIKDLKKENKRLASISKKTVDSWSAEDKYAYYLNLYNSLTLEVVVENYPLKSVKNLSNGKGPWVEKRFSVHGKKTSLNDIENNHIRGADFFDDPNIHFGLNCASIGCPSILPVAFKGKNVRKLLKIGKNKFLRDRKKNYIKLDQKTVYLSPIFDWYKGDFEKGYNGISSIKEFVKKNAVYIGDTSSERKLLQEGDFKIDYSYYDWKLNSYSKK